MTVKKDPLVLMCQWLNSGDKKESDANFSKYYYAITTKSDKGPGLYFYIQQRLASVSNFHEGHKAIANDLLQKLMAQHIQQAYDIEIEPGNTLKMRLEQERIEKDEHIPQVCDVRSLPASRIKQLAISLFLPVRGDIYERRIQNWITSLTQWVDSVMTFYPECAKSSELKAWHEEAEKINRQYSTLWKSGAELLTWALEEEIQNNPDDNIDSEFDMSNADDLSENVDNQDYEYRRKITNLIRTIKKQLEKEGQQATDAALGVVGGAHFILEVGDLLKLGSKVRIPMVGFLYRQAQQLVFDHFKRHSNQLEQSPPENPKNDDDNGFEDGGVFIEGQPDSFSLWQGKSVSAIPGENDRIKSKDDQLRDFEDIIQEIDFLLSSPLREAQASIKKAKSLSEKRLALARYEKQLTHNSLLLAVFECSAFEKTQDEIAAQLGITRDKVRSLQKSIKNILDTNKGGLHHA